MLEQTVQACTTVSTFSAEQTLPGAWDMHIYYFPIQSSAFVIAHCETSLRIAASRPHANFDGLYILSHAKLGYIFNCSCLAEAADHPPPPVRPMVVTCLGVMCLPCPCLQAPPTQCQAPPPLPLPVHRATPELGSRHFVWCWCYSWKHYWPHQIVNMLSNTVHVITWYTVLIRFIDKNKCRRTNVSWRWQDFFRNVLVI